VESSEIENAVPAAVIKSSFDDDIKAEIEALEDHGV
jgi:hypothetical protein